MTPEQIITAITYAKEADPSHRIEADNPIQREVWAAGLGHINATPEQIAYVIRHYYATAVPVNGWLQPITPGIIRQRITATREQAQARRQAALPPGKREQLPPLKDRNPEAWAAIQQAKQRGIHLTAKPIPD